MKNRNSPKNKTLLIFNIMNVSSCTEWQTTLIITSRTIFIKTDLCYCFQDLLALIKRSLHTPFIHIALFLLLVVVVLFSSQKSISSHHILAFNQQKSNLERKHFTNWTYTLFIFSENCTP